MPKPKRLDRRKFIQAAAGAAVASSLASCQGRKTPWRFFTDDEARTVEAICDRIVPPDEDPGAAQAGAAVYIDRQLLGPFRDHRATYRKGLAGVDQSSAALFGKRFVELSAVEKDKVLTACEGGEAPGETWKALPSKDFFKLIVDHTMQGYYGDPRHGGNRDGVSWKMLDLPNPPARGRGENPLLARKGVRP